MPVVSNLSAPLLDEATRNSKDFRFQAMKFSSFAEMAESLRNGSIDGAFIIAPLSIVLRQQGAGIKVVYIGNRNESTFVLSNSIIGNLPINLVGKKIAVPMRFSGHSLALNRLLENAGLHPSDLNIVEMNPPDMPNALASGALDGYFVGEPFAEKSVALGSARVFRRAEEVWPDFMCNLLIVREALIKEKPAQISLLVHSAVRAGFWAKKHPHEAASIVARYWGQPPDLADRILSSQSRKVDFDRYTPLESEFRDLAEAMRRTDLIHSTSIDGLIDDSFARSVSIENVSSFNDIVKPAEKLELRAELH
jgi:NitT/TauT family transport system substrate-binding protein